MYTKVRPQYCDNRYDPRMMDHMTYRNQISDPMLNPEPTDLLYETKRKFLVVTSSMRDRTQYRDPAYFKINFNEPFLDVVSIELSAGTLPNLGDISTVPFLWLDIPELNHINGADGTKYFGVLGLQYHPNRNYFNLDKSNTNDMPCTFEPIKSRLSAFTVQLRYPDGRLVTFGDDDPDMPSDMSRQMQLTFEIRVRVRKRIGIDKDVRNIPPPVI